jgi:alpha-beta hydrolase superfamily lysophospholipase
MAENDEWARCPECKKKVKHKNLAKHLQRVHDMKQSEAAVIAADMDKPGKMAGGKVGTTSPANKKIAVGVLVVIALVIVAVAARSYFISDENGTDGNGSDNGGQTDPTRAEFVTSDGFALVGNFYSARADVINISNLERPVLILVHGMNEKRSVWNSLGFVDSALSWGFNVFVYDIRGHGESVYKNGVKTDMYSLTDDDFKNMDKDVRAAVQYAYDNYPTNGRMAVVGASIGANAALNAAVYESNVRAIALLSPSLNYRGLTGYQPIYDYGSRPIFMSAGQYEVVGDLVIPDDCRTLYDRALERVPGRDNVILNIYPNEGYHGTEHFKIDQFGTDLENYLKEEMITLP